MRRAALVLALVIGLVGVMLPVQAHRGSDDSRGDSRHESNSNSDRSEADSDDSDRGDRKGNRNDDEQNNGDDDRDRDHRSRRVIRLSGANELPAADPDGSGWAKVRLSSDDGTVCYTIKVKNIDAVVAAHIHVGAADVNGGVVVDLGILNADSNVRGNSTVYRDCVENVAAALIDSIKAHKSAYYLNVHTAVYPDGAIRGQLGKVKST